MNKFFYVLIIFIFLLDARENKAENNFYVCTRVYCGADSLSYQRVYWQCATVMFASSKKCNPEAKHILFTNKSIKQIPVDISNQLKRLSVEIITIPMIYRTPKGYYQEFQQNTFYIFDMIKYLSNNTDDTEVRFP